MRFVVITFLVPILALLASVRAAPSLGVRGPCSIPELGPLVLEFYPESTGHMHFGEEYEFDFDVYACYGTEFGPWDVQFYLTEIIVTEFNGTEFNADGARFIKHYMTTMNVHGNAGSGKFTYTIYLPPGLYMMEYLYVSFGETLERSPALYTVDASQAAGPDGRRRAKRS